MSVSPAFAKVCLGLTAVAAVLLRGCGGHSETPGGSAGEKMVGMWVNVEEARDSVTGEKATFKNTARQLSLFHSRPADGTSPSLTSMLSEKVCRTGSVELAASSAEALLDGPNADTTLVATIPVMRVHGRTATADANSNGMSAFFEHDGSSWTLQLDPFDGNILYVAWITKEGSTRLSGAKFRRK